LRKRRLHRRQWIGIKPLPEI